MGEDRPIGGYGIPTREGHRGDLMELHPSLTELEQAIRTLQRALQDVKDERDQLIRKVEELIKLAREGL